MLKLFKYILLLLIAIVIPDHGFGQKENLNKTSAGFPVNYEEDSVGLYTLPELLILNNGKKVKDSKTWNEKRRPEVLQLVEEYQFGKMPPKHAELSFNVFDKGTPVFQGTAVRKQVTVYFTKDTSVHKMNILIYLPSNSDKPVPLYFTLSFFCQFFCCG